MTEDLDWNNATAADVALAWKLWDAEKPMTQAQQRLLRETPDGGRDLFPPRAQASLTDRQAMHKGAMPITMTKSHPNISVAVRRDLSADQLGALLATAMRPLIRRLDAAEAEIKAGHARIKELEGKTDGN